MSTEEKRGSAGPRAIAGQIERLTRAALAKRGLAGAQVVAEWPAIVGSTLAAHTCPMRIAWSRGEAGDGTLHLRVSSGAMATQLQHLEPLVLERINGFFGYRAVARLAISQGPLPRPRKPARPPLRQAPPEEVERRLTAVEDPEVKAALAALGKWVLGKKG